MQGYLAPTLARLPTSLTACFLPDCLSLGWQVHSEPSERVYGVGVTVDQWVFLSND